MKIKKSDMPISIPACYELETDTIYYVRELDKYPALKKAIINHEIQHQQHKYNPFFHIYLDYKDASIFRFGKHRRQFSKLLYWAENLRPRGQDKHKYKTSYKTFFVDFVYSPFMVLLMIILTLLNPLAMLLNKKK